MTSAAGEAHLASPCAEGSTSNRRGTPLPSESLLPKWTLPAGLPRCQPVIGPSCTRWGAQNVIGGAMSRDWVTLASAVLEEGL